MKTKDFVAADLIKKLQTLEGLTNDERSNLIGLLRQHKKYGLVWEDKPEDVEERLREELPVLREVKDKAIIGTPPNGEDGGGLPNHILIEGDNLEALTALSYTHEGKIDVIYIDPPYNTGNKDFVYNDSFVDSEDSYRHSKWLSFMNKRLKIAKKLLSDKGVIFISIDDNEQANLKLLCDEVFGSQNFIANVIWEKKYTVANDAQYFSDNHDFVVCYAHHKELFKIGQLPRTEEMNAAYKIQITILKALGRRPLYMQEVEVMRMQTLNTPSKMESRLSHLLVLIHVTQQRHCNNLKTITKYGLERTGNQYLQERHFYVT